MELKRLDKQSGLDSLIGAEFLQSIFWAELITKEGEIVERFGAEENGEIKAVISIIRKPLFSKFFYYYAPRGPRGEKTAIEFLYKELRKNLGGAVFLRVEPEELAIVSGDASFEKGIEFKKSFDLQPKKTLFLDLSLDTEELLSAMHQKTRYNIKLAEKKGVKISMGSTSDFAELWRLMTLTGERDGFRLHTRAHYKNLLGAPEYIKLFFASYEGKKIATGLFCFFNGRVTYLHGASDNEARNLMAPYLLQWEVIKQAQAAGYKFYDFYGIDEKKWPGVTRFKLGFGGFIKEYPGTYDLVFRPFLYGFYEFLRKLRRVIK